MTTLHAYVLRELLKTFGLTLAALTALFTMGGGLLNIMRTEGLTPADLFRFFPLLVPGAIALTMPPAALFAATMVYGRLAADNELVACRAAGINVQRVFLPVLLLAVFVTAATLLLSNFVIPGYAGRLYQIARTNLRSIALQRLQLKGYIRYEWSGHHLFVTAEDARNVSEEALEARGLRTGPGLDYLLITAPTFLQLDPDGRIVRYTAARAGLFEFDTRGEGVRVRIYANEARDYELGRTTVRIRDQWIGPIQIPLEFPVKPSMADLNRLLTWMRTPWQEPRLAKKTGAFLADVQRAMILGRCRAELDRDGLLRLDDDRGQHYEITAATAELDEHRVRLHDVAVSVRREGWPRPLRYEAPLAEFVPQGGSDESPLVDIRLLPEGARPVREYHPQSAEYNEGRQTDAVNLTRIEVPAAFSSDGAALLADQVYDPELGLPEAAALDEKLVKERSKLWQDAKLLGRRLRALVHFRLSFPSSTLVTLLMGAVLGAIFRGGRALAAFGLAFIPFGAALVMTIMGRQLSEGASTAAIGPLVSWGGLALIGLADVVILRVGVRR